MANVHSLFTMLSTQFENHHEFPSDLYARNRWSTSKASNWIRFMWNDLLGINHISTAVTGLCPQG